MLISCPLIWYQVYASSLRITHFIIVLLLPNKHKCCNFSLCEGRTACERVFASMQAARNHIPPVPLCPMDVCMSADHQKKINYIETTLPSSSLILPGQSLCRRRSSVPVQHFIFLPFHSLTNGACEQGEGFGFNGRTLLAHRPATTADSGPFRSSTGQQRVMPSMPP